MNFFDKISLFIYLWFLNLKIGCAVGRSCFELSKLFHDVIGIDYSLSFINHCNKILLEKEVNYECTLEGNIRQKLVAKLDSDVVQLAFLNSKL